MHKREFIPSVQKFDAACPDVDFFRDHPDKLSALLRDLKRAQANGQIAFTEDGLMIIKGHTGMQIGGVFHSSIMRHELVQRAMDDKDPEALAHARRTVMANRLNETGEGYFRLMPSHDHNLLPDDGLDFVLDVLFYTDSKISTWYQGPFKSNWTPVAGALSNWAGAGSGPLATEVADADITVSARQAATFGAAATGDPPTIATSASTALTLDTGASLTLYGSTLNSVSTIAYNATDQKLIAATAFGTAKSGLAETDVINLDYSIAADSS